MRWLLLSLLLLLPAGLAAQSDDSDRGFIQGLLENRLLAADLDSEVARVEPVAREHRGGFLAIRSPRAAELVRAVRQRGVHCDARNDVLRLGPAPYSSDAQLDEAASHLVEAVRALT